MPNQILTSLMFLSRAQAIRNLRKHIPDSLSGFTSLISLFFVSSILLPLSLSAQTGSDSLNSQVPVTSYILKETGSSTVLMAKDVDRPVSPASLTKILTCTMAIESGRLEQEVLITKESTMVEPSKAGFKPGERIKLVDLVKAAMVNSSNDAAFAIAIYLSGNVDSFVVCHERKGKNDRNEKLQLYQPCWFRQRYLCW
jgi:D-alanyl-D-alanine carboxypeptidase (penicillin-binding protein 5/6)